MRAWRVAACAAALTLPGSSALGQVAGVLITSPALVDPTDLDPDGAVVRTLTGPSAVGTIRDGASQPLGPGDVVFIPAGIAHGFSEITEPITYIVYRIDPDQLVELKGR